MDNKVILQTAVSTISRIFNKYNFSKIKEQDMVEELSTLSYYGKQWYDAYYENNKLIDKEERTAEEEKRMEELANEIVSCNNSIEGVKNFDVACELLADSKFLIQKLNTGVKNIDSKLFDLSNDVNVYETRCNDLKDEYLETGVSPYLINDFMKQQCEPYNEAKSKLDSLNKQVGVLEAKSSTMEKDSRVLASAVKSIEKECYFRYFEENEVRYAYRFMYQLKTSNLLKQKIDAQKNNSEKEL